MKLTITTTAALALMGFGLAGLPASAAPVPALGLTQALDLPITNVAMSRMERRRMMRNRSAMRRNKRRPSQAGNAQFPSRPLRAQSQGQTTGGPRN